MISSLVVLAGILCILFHTVSGNEGTSWPLYSTHPHAIYHRQAQEIVMTFASQLNANKVNASQLKSLLLSIPDETVKIFQLAGMTLSTGGEGNLEIGDSRTSNENANTKQKSPSEVLANYPVLHMLLNQFMLSQNPSDKQLFLELFNLAMEHGADPSTPLNNDPPLYIKGIMIKEIELVKSIVEHSHKSITNEIIARSSKISRLLKMIYAMPAEVVPIAKLLLHVEKLTHKYYESLPVDAKTNFNTTDVAARLLLGAKLDRPTLSAAQLMHYSTTYNQTIQHLTSFLLPENVEWNIPGGLETTKIISMYDISMTMNELLVIIPEALIESILMLPRDRKHVAIEHFIDIHVIPDEADRNCFHYLSAANSVKMVEAFAKVFDHLIDDLNDKGTPHEGRNEINHSHAENKLRQLAETLLNNLSQVDHRGHTPLSYAEVRYGSHSPIAMTLKALISRLIRIFEGDFSNFSMEDGDADLEEMEALLIEHDGAVTVNENSANVEIDGTQVTEVALEDQLNSAMSQEGEIEEASQSVVDNENKRREIPESDSGGWNPSRLTIFDEAHSSTDDVPTVEMISDDVKMESISTSKQQYYDRCDILEIWDGDLPNAEEFFVRYINTATPVVFRGAALKKTAQMYQLREKFSKKKFVRNYGSVQVTASTLPYSDSFGVPSSMKSMKDVANSDQVVTSGLDAGERISVPLYTFTTASPQWSQKLNKDVPFPEPILSKESAKENTKSASTAEKKAAYSFELQFYLGPAGTGAPVHFHGHAINTLAYGEKKWILYPPNEGFYTTIAALDFFQMLSSYDHDKSIHSLTSNHTVNEHIADLKRGALRCTQYAGDIMYVPTMWAHGTLNTKQSIGVAHEFSVESFCME